MTPPNLKYVICIAGRSYFYTASLILDSYVATIHSLATPSNTADTEEC